MEFNSSSIEKGVLELDLEELAVKILRELFISSCRLALSSRKKTIDEWESKKLLKLLKRLFRLRSYFDFHLYQNKLYAMGICLEREVFFRSLKAELSRFSLGSVFIYSQVTSNEVAIFSRHLSEKTLPPLRNLNLPRFLEEKKVTSIRVKKSEPEDPFVEETRTLIEKADDVRVGTLAKLSLQEEPKVILDILLKKIEKDIDLEGRVKLDFRLRVFQSVILEEFSKLSIDKIKELLVKEFRGKNREMILSDKKYLEGLKSLAKALSYHPHRNYLSSQLKEILVSLAIPDDFFENILDSSGLIGMKTSKGF